MSWGRVALIQLVLALVTIIGATFTHDDGVRLAPATKITRTEGMVMR